MLLQKKFKRLKVNAGFTLSIANGTMAVKLSETHYRVLGDTGPAIKANRAEVVWADEHQIKAWYQW
jgi:3D (Asp-Asp-Asp) domain-containing protein